MTLTSPTYLGDGIYLQPWLTSPGGVILTTGSHILDDPNLGDTQQIIFIEPELIPNLIQLLS